MSAYETFTTLPAYKGMNDEGDLPKWSGKTAPPPKGTKIEINFNNLGTATVFGYFVEDGWLGLLCELDSPPAWHAKQNKGDKTAHIFGVEFDVAA